MHLHLMDAQLLRIADYFFLGFHTALILFNLFGWIFKSTRKLHLAVILLTFASWFILGIWYGWGYCPITDWHWAVLRELGYWQLPPSYVGYLIERIIGLRINYLVVDILTFGLAFIALGLSVKVNFFERKQKA